MQHICIDYRTSVVGHMCNVTGIVVQRHMPIMQNMYTSAPSHIVGFSEFKGGIYSDTVVSHVHMN